MLSTSKTSDCCLLMPGRARPTVCARTLLSQWNWLAMSPQNPSGSSIERLYICTPPRLTALCFAS